MVRIGLVCGYSRGFLRGAFLVTPEGLYGLLSTWPHGMMVVSLDQTILYWDRSARNLLGHTAERLVGAKCSDVPWSLGGSGLTSDCVDSCACMRYARAGLVPPASVLGMRTSWGEVKWVDVRPVVVPWLPEVGTVVLYLLRERESQGGGAGRDLVVSDVSGPVEPDRGAGEPEGIPTRALTEREMDVLRLLALGWDTERIGAELGVTDHTVRNHITNLRVKLGAKSRFEAVMAATRLGLLRLE